MTPPSRTEKALIVVGLLFALGIAALSFSEPSFDQVLLLGVPMTLALCGAFVLQSRRIGR